MDDLVISCLCINKGMKSLSQRDFCTSKSLWHIYSNGDMETTQVSINEECKMNDENGVCIYIKWHVISHLKNDKNHSLVGQEQ